LKSSIRHIILLILLVISGTAIKAQVNHRHFVFAGRVSLSEDRFVEAVRSFNTAIQTKPDHFEAWFLRGIAKYNLGDFRGAAEDFSETIRLHPLYARAYHYRGIVNDRLSNYFDAKADFTRAMEIDPYNADLYVAFGATRMQLNELEAAIADYDMALLINPNLSYAWLNRGIAKRMLNRKEEALADMSKAIYHDHFSVDAWLKRGMLRAEMEDATAAMEDFGQALRIDDKNPLIYFQRAIAFLQLGDTLSALNDYEMVNVLDNRNALTYYNRALLHGLRGELEESRILYEEVVKINPQNIYSHFNLGIVNYQMKKPADAIENFSKVIDLYPAFVGAWINRSLMKKELKDEKGSKSDYDRAMAIIEAINTEGEQPETLFARYADSSYFDKIISLESDFVSGNMAQGRPQFQNIDIKPFSNFIVWIANDPLETEKLPEQKKYSDIYISMLNTLTSGSLNFGYVMYPSMLDATESVSEEVSVQKINVQSDEIVKRFIKAGINQSRSNFNLAKQDYELLKSNPLLAPASLLNLGVLLFELEELRLSDDRYDRTITISSQKAPEPVALNPSLREPDYTNALSALENLVKLQPDNAIAFYNLANIKLLQGNYHRAIDDYSEAIRIEPAFGEAYYNRSLTLLYLGENKLACADLSKAGQHGITEAYVVIRKYCGK
jgi:tetratricopeptide (TPR) repeat protein